MQLEKVNLNIEHLSIWLSDTQGIVYHQGHKSLYRLEPLSLALLFALDDGINEQQTISELQQHSPLSAEQIAPSMQQVKALMVNDQIDRTYADGLYPEFNSHFKQQVKPGDFTLKVANSTFAITSQDHELLSHLKTLLAPITLNNEAGDITEVDFLFEIEHPNEIYTLYSNDQAVEENLTQEQVMPVLIDRLQILSYQQSPYTFGFHGAALESINADNPHRVLLPGISGAGKSTLTAELSKQGYQVFSDEIIAINDDHTLNTLELPMAIKSGSWQHIAKLYPEITTQPEWHRVDGRILKYIWPEQIAHNKTAELVDVQKSIKTLLISPNYQAGCEPQIKALSIIETIELVTNGGYQLGVELTEQRVEQLIDFCQSISAYQITYASSAQAQKIINELVN
ncbi:hypothetical protein [Thalassomonas sp. M1454]|uniref:hypothetical protein n=1 Tax=Thalassomonas sp. M1454 TaxID=2594477 RepID=UPI00117E432E|nr:hypothetical protein [Thalassomonas sp. M1454]TRX57205.1 hypothetical protein FNN08_06815 [Thalassomonas sp. M1454]